MNFDSHKTCMPRRRRRHLADEESHPCMRPNAIKQKVGRSALNAHASRTSTRRRGWAHNASNWRLEKGSSARQEIAADGPRKRSSRLLR
jgi:hypothetical protein